MREPTSISDLHELADGEQVGHSDVIATEEGLSAEKHGLQVVQSAVELRESTGQTPLVHLRAGLSRDQDLNQGGRDKNFTVFSYLRHNHTLPVIADDRLGID